VTCRGVSLSVTVVLVADATELTWSRVRTESELIILCPERIRKP
jgi:hypothetical protein